MKKHLLVIFVAVFLSACTTASTVSVATPPRGKAQINIGCFSIDAILTLATAHTQSRAAVVSAIRAELAAKRCGGGRPVIVDLDIHELTYKDFAGVQFEVWKIKHENDFWVIARSESIRRTGQSI